LPASAAALGIGTLCGNAKPTTENTASEMIACLEFPGQRVGRVEEQWPGQLCPGRPPRTRKCARLPFRPVRNVRKATPAVPGYHPVSRHTRPQGEEPLCDRANPVISTSVFTLGIPVRTGSCFGYAISASVMLLLVVPVVPQAAAVADRTAQEAAAGGCITAAAHAAAHGGAPRFRPAVPCPCVCPPPVLLCGRSL
jgi:hypothetical protein